MSIGKSIKLLAKLPSIYNNLNQENIKDYILDSGATTHMTSHKNLLNDFENYEVNLIKKDMLWLLKMDLL
jgi:hypothetical protein